MTDTTTYRASVTYVPEDDNARVTFRGHRTLSYVERAPEWFDDAAQRNLARRAVRHLFDVDGMSLSVEPEPFGEGRELPGRYRVTATA